MRRRLLLVTPFVVAALVVVGSINAGTNTPPILTVPGPITAEATGPLGATVTFSATATDAEDEPDPDPVCSPVSGSTFAIGETTVSCDVTDSGSLMASDSFIVTVEDTTGPAFSDVPADQTATEDEIVTFDDPTANDLVDGPRPVTCTPASGFTATVTVTVNCTASDLTLNESTASFLVTVTPAANTPPVLSLPATITAEATSSAGAVVDYSTLVSASDAEDDPDPIPSCGPASGSTFPLGTTQVSCTVTDGGGQGDTGSFDVVIVDTTAPAVTVPENKTVEANGPDGAIVNYEAPTAVDVVDGPIAPPDIKCTRPSGARFPLGTTVVTCSATDSGGRLGLASFTIAVEDTTPPVLTAPASISVQSSSPVAADDARIREFLAGATATDIVDQNVEVTNNAPAAFRLGTTPVVFTAEDDSGNTTARSATVTITTRPVAPPAAADTTPPGNVRGVRAVAGNLSVSITWRPPSARDFHHVTIARTPGRGEEPESLVYRGRNTSFVARGLEDGVEYRFLIVAYDKAGNRAAGVAVVVFAERRNLLGPVNGATIKPPRRFAWRAVEGADYYNIQFWHNGKKLSAWPERTRFVLRSSWRFEGKRYRLTPGTWRVFVWPGFGDKTDANYGGLHVDAAFVVRRR